MKKILFAIFLINFTYQIQAETTTANNYAGGSGTTFAPYQIATLAQLKHLSETTSDWNKHFILISDIDASDTKNWNNAIGFMPIGDAWSGERQQEAFTGTLNGNFHKISNLYINTSQIHVGLFGYTEGANIRNLSLTNVDILSTDYVGGLIGSSNNTEVKNCSVTGKVQFETQGGLLIGKIENSKISYCHTKGTVIANNIASGGLVGYCIHSDINNSYSTAAVSGSMSGGLTGICSYSSNIENCFATGDVSALDMFAGGLIGYNIDSTNIKNTYAIGKVNSPVMTGGLIAFDSLSYVSGSYFDPVLTTQTNGIGYDANKQYVIGLATGDFSNKNLLLNAGWDFDSIWDMSPLATIDSYTRPYLRVAVRDYMVGTVSSMQNKASLSGDNYYNQGEQVCITVVPNSGYRFNGWQLNGVIVSTNNSYTFTCTENAEYTAVIVPDVDFAGGIGTISDPYQIEKIKQLQNIGNYDFLLDKHYILLHNIDASDTKNWDNGKGFIPIGSKGTDIYNSFTGSINGNGHIINNLYINRPDCQYVGLIAHMKQASVSKLGMTNCDITGASYVGAIVGFIRNTNNGAAKHYYMFF